MDAALGQSFQIAAVMLIGTAITMMVKSSSTLAQALTVLSQISGAVDRFSDALAVFRDDVQDLRSEVRAMSAERILDLNHAVATDAAPPVPA